MTIAVILPTHNPHPGRLARTLAALAAQSLPAGEWETLVVDNASTPPLESNTLPDARPSNLQLLREPTMGLSAARQCGIRAARADLCVFVDDDNVLAATYLADVVQIFRQHPRLGAAGGPSRPEFETHPPEWTHEFFPLLALRDLGPTPLIAELEREPLGNRVCYPECAPIGAGMALRRAAILPWLKAASAAALSDRRGSALSSGGDNDIVFTLLHHGWQVGYFPSLSLTHLIPTGRLDPRYLARLNRGIQHSWMHVLSRHHANPWVPVPHWTVPLRQIKAWFVSRAWSGDAAHVRWQGICGHFAGRAVPPQSR